MRALDREALRDHALGRIDDIDTLVPNLRLDTASDGSAARIYIRGVGNDFPGDLTRSPGVGLYLDDVYVGSSQGSLFALSDVERVEVLRGPQGTLYGRNSVGGAVRIVTRKPQPETSAEVQIGLGSFHAVETHATVNAPLLEDRMLARLSLTSQARDGYTRNVRSGDRADDRRLLGGRLALRMLPSEAVVVDLGADLSIQHENARGGRCRFNADSPAARGLLPNGVAFQSAIPLLQAASGFVDRCLRSQGLDDLEYASDLSGKTEREVKGGSGTLSWQPSNLIGLRATAAWRRTDVGRQVIDIDMTESRAASLRSSGGGHEDEISAELGLSGRTRTGQLTWTLGAYANQDESRGSAQFLSLVDAGLLPGFSPLDFSAGILDAHRNHGLAGYGQIALEMTPRLGVSAGVRRLVERKETSVRLTRLVGDPDRPDFGPVQLTARGAPNDFRDADRFDAWLGLIDLRYRIGDDSQLYAQWSSGYRSGGRNSALNRSATGLESFDPEKLDAYELGFKSSWWKQALVVNLALFHFRYRQIQQNRFTSNDDGTFTLRTENNGNARLLGGELEVQAAPLPGLTLFAGAGWVRTRYVDNPVLSRERLPGADGVLDGFVCGNGRAPDPAECAGLPAGAQLSSSDDQPRIEQRRGLAFYNTPALHLTLSAAYRFETRLGALEPRLTWFQQGRVTYAPETRSGLADQGRLGLLDATLALRLRDGKTEIALWSRNLLDRRYTSTADSFDDGFGVTVAYPGPPRMWGIEIRRSFSGL